MSLPVAATIRPLPNREASMFTIPPARPRPLPRLMLTNTGVLVGVAVGVMVGVLVGVAVGVFVGVLVGVFVGVFVGV
jgi:hypothetical protein